MKVWVLLILWLPPEGGFVQLSDVATDKRAYRSLAECVTARDAFIDNARTYHSRGEFSRCEELEIKPSP
jgi:hypothetical protein